MSQNPAPGKGMRRGPWPPAMAIAVVVLLLDQASKWWIVETVMTPPRVIEVLPFFNLVMAWNRGVSFGMFNDGVAAGVLIAVALAVTAGLLVWLRKVDRLWVALSIGMIVGGAIGNVIDRFRWGAVADFLDVYVGQWHWPAFNIADSGITIGAVMLVIDALFLDPTRHKDQGGEQEGGKK